MQRVVFAVLGLLLLLVLVGASYQAILTRADAQRFPEPGRLVDVGGFRLKMYCTGEGSPTIILEAGLGDNLAEWRRVQPELAGFARVCSSNRAGYGGSDPGPMPRTSARIAEELHTLLQTARERLPYLLVGHSFGGYNVRVFNGKYPDQVIGIVLVEANQEDQYQLLPPAWKALSAAMLVRWQRQARWAPVYINLGVARFQLRLQGIHASHLFLQSKYLKTRASELESIRVSAEQARAAGNIGNKPLVVLTAGKNADASLRSSLPDQQLKEFQRVWVNDLQARLARLSTRGKRLVVTDSGHDMPKDRPDVIVNAVRELHEQARQPPQPQ